MSAEYSEDILVQQTAADYLEQELGWHTVYAYSDETFGPNGILGRSSRVGVVLFQSLRQSLTRFNPSHPASAYNDAVETFTHQLCGNLFYNGLALIACAARLKTVLKTPVNSGKSQTA